MYSQHVFKQHADLFCAFSAAPESARCRSDHGHSEPDPAKKIDQATVANELTVNTLASRHKTPSNRSGRWSEFLRSHRHCIEMGSHMEALKELWSGGTSGCAEAGSNCAAVLGPRSVLCGEAGAVRSAAAPAVPGSRIACTARVRRASTLTCLIFDGIRQDYVASCFRK